MIFSCNNNAKQKIKVQGLCQVEGAYIFISRRIVWWFLLKHDLRIITQDNYDFNALSFQFLYCATGLSKHQITWIVNFTAKLSDWAVYPCSALQYRHHTLLTYTTLNFPFSVHVRSTAIISLYTLNRFVHILEIHTDL